MKRNLKKLLNKARKSLVCFHSYFYSHFYLEEELESLRTKIKAEIAKATSLQSQLEKAGEEGRALQDKLVSEKEKRKELEFESEKRMREFEKQLIQSGTAGLKEELQVSRTFFGFNFFRDN